MKASLLFKQYVWLVSVIRQSRCITLSEINKRWQATSFSEGQPLSRSTFNRHRDAISEIFGITINCDSKNRYYIESVDMLRKDSVQQWMLSTLTVSNIVSEARGLHDRILLETIPTDGRYLQQVVEAMRRGLCICVHYCRYGQESAKEWIVEPYCIKLFRRRWYLLCRYKIDKFMLLSLDRIIYLSLTDQKFTMDPMFDAEQYFSEYFGVMTDSRIPLCNIVLRAYGSERFALKDLPLHHSQKLIQEQEDYVDFEICLRPTSDFLAHILSRGRWVEIISPANIASEINDLHKEAIKYF